MSKKDDVIQQAYNELVTNAWVYDRMRAIHTDSTTAGSIYRVVGMETQAIINLLKPHVKETDPYGIEKSPAKLTVVGD